MTRSLPSCTWLSTAPNAWLVAFQSQLRIKGLSGSLKHDFGGVDQDVSQSHGRWDSLEDLGDEACVSGRTVAHSKGQLPKGKLAPRGGEGCQRPLVFCHADLMEGGGGVDSGE